jgi:hypothetical protein
MVASLKRVLMAGILFGTAQAALSNNPCHSGVPVQFAATSLQQAQQRLELERKYGVYRQESINAFKSAQQRLFKEYANKAAYDFGVIGETECFEYLTSQQWGQRVQLTPNVKQGARPDKWFVFLNGKPAMNPSGEPIESVFNQVGAFIQTIIFPDDEVISVLIRNSQTSYAGTCPCPYNTDVLGNSCGTRSAYSQTGGKDPICFPGDVSREHVEQSRREMFKAVYLFLHTR